MATITKAAERKMRSDLLIAKLNRATVTAERFEQVAAVCRAEDDEEEAERCDRAAAQARAEIAEIAAKLAALGPARR
jgi:hypothetical protein